MEGSGENPGEGPGEVLGRVLGGSRGGSRTYSGCANLFENGENHNRTEFVGTPPPFPPYPGRATPAHPPLQLTRRIGGLITRELFITHEL